MNVSFDNLVLELERCPLFKKQIYIDILRIRNPYVLVRDSRNIAEQILRDNSINSRITKDLAIAYIERYNLVQGNPTRRELMLNLGNKYSISVEIEPFPIEEEPFEPKTPYRKETAGYILPNGQMTHTMNFPRIINDYDSEEKSTESNNWDNSIRGLERD